MSEESKKYSMKFKPDALSGWRKWAVECLDFSGAVMASHYAGELTISEEVCQELNKLCVNAFIFRNFLDELSPVLKVDKAGHLDLLEEDIANVWKCLLAMSESKKYLKEASISLEVH
jgi:hypothetical protein